MSITILASQAGDATWFCQLLHRTPAVGSLPTAAVVICAGNTCPCMIQDVHMRTALRCPFVPGCAAVIICVWCVPFPDPDLPGPSFVADAQPRRLYSSVLQQSAQACVLAHLCGQCAGIYRGITGTAVWQVC